MTVVLGPGLARHPPARGDRSRARGRLQSQGHLGVRRPARARRSRRSSAPSSTTARSPNRRGSLNVDDEGTPTQRTVLIEKGILRGYLQDRLNARLMGMPLTGNGRRESFAHVPMPRMTNTFMLAGETTPEDIIRSVDRGLYAVSFGGGQVDITSGKFVFSASEAYLIEGGQVDAAGEGRDAHRQRARRADAHHARRQRPAASTKASAPAARTDSRCRSASACRRSASTA